MPLAGTRFAAPTRGINGGWNLRATVTDAIDLARSLRHRREPRPDKSAIRHLDRPGTPASGLPLLSA